MSTAVTVTDRSALARVVPALQMFALLVADKTLDQNWAQTVYSRSESHALDSADAMCVLIFGLSDSQLFLTCQSHDYSSDILFRPLSEMLELACAIAST